MRSLISLFLTVVTLLLAACSGGPAVVTGDLTISGAWVRAASEMLPTPADDSSLITNSLNTAAYFTIANTGSQPDRLAQVEADIARAVELHTVTFENDVMRMSQVEGIDLPPGSRTELKPGGFHVMLIGINRNLQAGEKVSLTLTFERAGVVAVEAEVRAP